MNESEYKTLNAICEKYKGYKKFVNSMYAATTTTTGSAFITRLEDVINAAPSPEERDALVAAIKIVLAERAKKHEEQLNELQLYGRFEVKE